jgi:outer membrane protein assembly factor BamB
MNASKHLHLRQGLAIAAFAALTGCAAPGSVYLGASDKNLYALLGSDGSLRWKQALGGEVHSSPFHWAGTIIVGASDGVVYGLDADKGKALWHTALMTPEQAAALAPRSVISTAVMPINGRLMFGTGLGDVVEVAASNGAASLRAQLGAAGRQWLTASQDGSTVFAVSASGTAYAVDSRNGGVAWRQAVASPTGPAAETRDGSLAVPTQAGLVLLDAVHGGKILTSYTAAGRVEGVATDLATKLTWIVSSTGAVQVLELEYHPEANYHAVWTVTPNRATGYAPSYRGRGWDPAMPVIVAYADGTAASVGSITGEVNWTRRIDTDLAAPAIMGPLGPQGSSVVVLVSAAGHVFALNAADGSALWQQAGVVGGKVDARPTVP